MQAIYDILGSILIGGIVLLMLLQFNATVMEGAAAQTFTSIVQSNITSVAELVEYDFRKMGYRVGALPDSAILYADSNRIVFKGDIDNNGSVENVAYSMDPKVASGHVNPRSRILQRVVNGTSTEKINLGVTRFRLTYFDKDRKFMPGNPIPRPSLIGSIMVQMNVESTSPYDTLYQGGNWERTITPKNLR